MIYPQEGMIYHIKEGNQPLFPMLDGTNVAVPVFEMTFDVSPAIRKEHRDEAMFVMVEKGILERVGELQEIAPDANHCLLIGHAYRVEPETPMPGDGFTATATVGIALTMRDPHPSIQHTDKIEFASRVLLLETARNMREDNDNADAKTVAPTVDPVREDGREG